MPSPREVRALVEAAQRALAKTRPAAQAAAEQLRLPFRSVKEGFRPGDVASRLARAEKQGFDVLHPLYHGGTDFDPNRVGRLFAAPSEDTARSYMNHAVENGSMSERGMVLPLFTHKDAKVFDATRLPGTGHFGLDVHDPVRFAQGIEGKLAEASPKFSEVGSSQIGALTPDQLENYMGLGAWNAMEDSGTYDDMAKAGMDAVDINDMDWSGNRHKAKLILNPNAARLAIAEFSPRYADAIKKAKRIPTWMAGGAVGVGLGTEGDK
jgi:hypothetical protein